LQDFAMTDKVKQLHHIAREITEPESTIRTWIPAINMLNEFLQEYASFHIDPGQDIGAGETKLSSGLAISPVKAALCSREISRTAAFIKGLATAIRDLATSHRPVPLRILYAGCGPYALLVLPVMSLFSSDTFRCTLMDIHSEALEPAMDFITSLGFSDYVDEAVCTDAAAYQSDADHIPDIVISETMNAALRDEPQVMIFHHLYTVAPEAIFIPGKVSVRACLLDPAKEHLLFPAGYSGELSAPQRDRIDLGKIFTLSKESPGNATIVRDRGRIPAGRIMIPRSPDPRYVPRLLTRIRVYDTIVLKDYDCSLTLPWYFPGKPVFEGGEVVQFYYVTGKNPGFVCEIV
jgi:hypothetical protein